MKKHTNYIENSVCAPHGFSASGISAHIKKSLKPDLALIYSKVPAVAAAVYTKNQIKAAPLLLTKQNLKLSNNMAQAVIINSGNANACTGNMGKLHAKQTIKELAKNLKIEDNLVAVTSTGVIGVILPIDKIISHIPKLVEELNKKGGNKAAKAILTTDTFIKEVALEVELTSGKIRIGGIAKGSGMIHPNMATMLAFITTDADIADVPLQRALKLACDNSFNMISVDGDSSTNDMAYIMANKQAKNDCINTITHPDWKLFYAGLLEVCTNLAKQIATDGEGATKLITVNVSGAKNDKQAKLVAKSVVSSTLVKAAVFGNDANWGRIACAVGYADTIINPNKLEIALFDLPLFAEGMPLKFSEKTALKLLQQKNIIINISLGTGKAMATAWGCDLSYDYVKINAAYRT